MGGNRDCFRAWRVLGLGVVLAAAGVSSAAAQRPLQQVLDLNRQAMDAYTNLDIQQADRLLQEALQVAQSGSVGGAPLARTYLNLGVVYVGGLQDNARALTYFTEALQIDSGIQLDPLTSTPDIRQVFQLAQTRVGSGGGGGGNGLGAGQEPPTPGPATGNIPHDPVPEQLTQTAVPVYVEVPDEAPVRQVFVYYRGPGMREYKRSEMQRMSGGFGYEIPCRDVYSPKVEYYIVAFGRDGSPLGFAGSADSPVSVRVVAERDMPPPALPGQAPPEPCALDEECPPGMPGCDEGGGAGMGETCSTTLDCREGLVCDDNFCIADEGAEDDDESDGDDGDMPRFFAHVGFGIGAGYAASGMQADRRPKEGVSADQNVSYIASGDRLDPSNSNSATCGAPAGEYCVRVDSPGFLPTYSIRTTLGYYVYERLALAATLRFQLNSGQGNLASMLIGLRAQYLIGDMAAEGLNGSIFLGGGFGQIQLQPPQNGADEPFIISGLNSVQIGGNLGYRFMRNVGIVVTPEVHVMFPIFVFAADLTLALEIAF